MKKGRGLYRYFNSFNEEERNGTVDFDSEAREELVSYPPEDLSLRIKERGSYADWQNKPKGSQVPILEEHCSSFVLTSECWRCIIKEIHDDGIRVFATDTKNQFSSRFFTIKRSYYEELTLEPFECLEIDQQIDWVFKRIKSVKGQEIKKQELTIYKKLYIPEWQLRQQVERDMEQLDFLFQNL